MECSYARFYQFQRKKKTFVPSNRKSSTVAWTTSGKTDPWSHDECSPTTANAIDVLQYWL